MARPKRMGAYNALDDLPPGGAWEPTAGSWDEPEPTARDPWDEPEPTARDPWDEPGAGSGRPRLEPVPDPAPAGRGPRRRPARRRGSGVGAGPALDDLLPGPRGLSALDDLLPGPSNPPPQPSGRAGPGPGRPRRATARHLGVWNPLDGLPASPPAPTPAPPKARVSFRLPADLVEEARDAVAHLAGTADRATLTALAERALRTELARLAATHNHGHRFPPRPR